MSQNNEINIKPFFYDKDDKPLIDLEFIPKEPPSTNKFIEFLKQKSPCDFILTEGMENYVKAKLANSVGKTQMRNLFNLIRNSTNENYSKIHVKLIYMAGKTDTPQFKEFIKLLLEIYKNESSNEDGQSNLLNDFIESALAYHKFHAKN